MHIQNTDVRNQAGSEHLGLGRSFRGTPKGVPSPAFGRLLLNTGGHLTVKERGPGEMEFVEKTWWPRRAGSRSRTGSYFHRTEHTW